MIHARGLVQTFHTGAWGSAWAVALFALALWWGTAVFRRDNA